MFAEILFGCFLFFVGTTVYNVCVFEISTQKLSVFFIVDPDDHIDSILIERMKFFYEIMGLFFKLRKNTLRTFITREKKAFFRCLF
jgi:hypothetical protein